MTDERGVVRAISWRELFPWLIILRTFKIAIGPTVLTVATVATLLTPLGWWAGAWLFLPKQWDEARQRWVVEYPPAEHGVPLADQLPVAAREYLPAAPTGVIEPYLRLAEPLRHVFHINVTLRQVAYFVFGSLWALGLWALAGGFITRHAVLRLAHEHEPEVTPTARFAFSRWPWYFLTPLYPLLGVLLFGIPIAILGIPIYFSPGAGSIIAGMLWIFVVLASLAAAWLLAGLIFGWPLMWPAISAERDGDPFEAFSRSFSYVYGRPLHYFYYFVVAALFGALCLAVVHGAVLLVTEFGFWALAWGGGGENVAAIRSLVDDVLAGRDLSAHPNRALVFGSSLVALVVGLVRIVEVGYTFSFFWCVASAIYLLLRMDVDEKEMDEVHRDDIRPRPTPAAATTPAAAQPPAPTPPVAPLPAEPSV
jgi:hypothetical protein